MIRFLGTSKYGMGCLLATLTLGQGPDQAVHVDAGVALPRERVVLYAVEAGRVDEHALVVVMQRETI